MAKLYFYYAAMNAGKSTNLLQSAHNYEERNMKTLIFTPLFLKVIEIAMLLSNNPREELQLSYLLKKN